MHRLWISALAALFLCGCGGAKERFEYAPVSGIVTVNGAPVSDATVTFSPVPTADRKNPGPASIGTTDVSGRFTLTTIRGEAGAVIGQHRVAVSTEKIAREAEQPATTRTTPAGKNGGSKLAVEVPASGTDQANFSLEFSEKKRGRPQSSS